MLTSPLKLLGRLTLACMSILCLLFFLDTVNTVVLTTLGYPQPLWLLYCIGASLSVVTQSATLIRIEEKISPVEATVTQAILYLVSSGILHVVHWIFGG